MSEFCPRCGAQSHAGSSFCGECGSSLTASRMDSPKHPHLWRKGFILILAGLILAAALIVTVPQFRHAIFPSTPSDQANDSCLGCNGSGSGGSNSETPTPEQPTPNQMGPTSDQLKTAYEEGYREGQFLANGPTPQFAINGDCRSFSARRTWLPSEASFKAELDAEWLAGCNAGG